MQLTTALAIFGAVQAAMALLVQPSKVPCSAVKGLHIACTPDKTHALAQLAQKDHTISPSCTDANGTHIECRASKASAKAPHHTPHCPTFAGDCVEPENPPRTGVGMPPRDAIQDDDVAARDGEPARGRIDPLNKHLPPCPSRPIVGHTIPCNPNIDFNENLVGGIDGKDVVEKNQISPASWNQVTEVTETAEGRVQESACR